MSRVFKKDNTTIYHGDAIDVLDEDIDDGSIDLIFADPPYNIGKRYNNFVDKWPSEKSYLDWSYTWLNLCLNKLNDTGSMYVMTSTQFMPYYDIFLRNKINIISRIIWHYDSSGVQAKKYYGSLYEPILFCVKNKDYYTFNAENILVEAKTGAKRKLIDYRGGKPKQYNTKKVPGNVWYIPRVRYRMPEYENHPTQKPIKLLERIILASSNENELILDPFGGTFTTSYVAKQLLRKSISIEKEIEYVKIGLRRCSVSNTYNDKKLLPVSKSYTKDVNYTLDI